MKSKLVAAGMLGAAFLTSAGIAFAQTASPSSTASPTPTASPSASPTTNVPSGAPSTGAALN